MDTETQQIEANIANRVKNIGRLQGIVDDLNQENRIDKHRLKAMARPPAWHSSKIGPWRALSDDLQRRTRNCVARWRGNWWDLR